MAPGVPTRGAGLLALALLAAACRQQPTVEPVPSSVLSPVLLAAESCPGPERTGSPVGPEGLVDALRGHVPRFLPEDMGVLVAWTPSARQPSAGAAWADQRCRTVTVRFHDIDPTEAAHPGVGTWTAAREQRCENRVLPDVTCLEYRGGADDGLVVLSTVAVGEEEAQEIRDSLPLELGSSGG